MTLFGCGKHDGSDVRRALARSASDDANKRRERAEHGDARAQFDLAMRLFKDTNDKTAASNAAVCMRKAAEQKLPDAEFSLGLMHDQGRGVEVDKAQSGQLILKAAEHGLPIAQHTAGNMYERGLNGMSTNFVEAAKWFRKAA